MNSGFLFDPDERLSKLWYYCHDPRVRKEHPALYWEDRSAYATSSDGVTWGRPELNVVTWEGSKHNNLVSLPPGGGDGAL